MVMRSKPGGRLQRHRPRPLSTSAGSRGCRSARSGRASSCAGWTRRPGSSRPTHPDAARAGLAARPGRRRGPVDRPPRRLLLPVRELRLLLPRRQQRLPRDGRPLAHVTGPYVDRDGVPMLEGGGTELLRGYNEFARPRRRRRLRRPGVDWFAHHYYDRDDGGTPKLSVRALDWRDGWPRLGDPLSGAASRAAGRPTDEIVNRESGAPLDNPACGYEGADIRLGADRAARARSGGRGPRRRLVQPQQPLQQQGRRGGRRAAPPTAPTSRSGAGWTTTASASASPPPATASSRIENELSGRVLDAAGCGGAGANVQLWDWPGSACQQFRLEPAGHVLLPGIDVRGCRARAGGTSATRELGYATVTERRSGRALVMRRGELVLGGRRGHGRAAQWSLRRATTTRSRSPAARGT